MSSRTDKHVHALNQVFHIDVPNFWSENIQKFEEILKRRLPSTLKIKKIEIVSEDFHSRFHAKSRSYRYVFSFDSVNPFNYKYLTEMPKNVDLKKIESAIKLFEGTHNFKNFRKAGSQTNSEIRTIFKTKSYIYKNMFILGFLGNAFLRSQIRLMTNCLIEIGQGTKTEEQLLEQLNLEKIHCRKVAPPNGLYLFKVNY